MNAQLLMQPKEVPIGAVVFPCAPGEDKPDTEAPLRLLVGGVPARVKWYPCDADGGNLHAGFEYKAMLEGTRFAPAKGCSPKDAPVGQELAVFIDGEPAKYDNYDNFIDVVRLSDGTFISVCGYAYDHWLRRYQLPDNAVLVPHGDCKYDKAIDDAVVLPTMYKGSDVWKMLTENGAAFYFRQSPWPNETEEPDESYYVWLPDGWALLPGDKQYTSAKFEKVVDATGKMRARVVWAEHFGKKAGGISLENDPVVVEGGETFA